MRARIGDAIRSTVAALSLLGFFVAFVLAGAGRPPAAIVLASASLGVIALAIAVGPRAVLTLFGIGDDRADPDDAGGRDDASEWWLAGFEPVTDDVWDSGADYALAIGLAIVGVASLAGVATHSGGEPPVRLLVLGMLCLNCALVVLAGASLNE